MKTIIESLKSANFPLSQEDAAVYQNVREKFAEYGCSDDHQILFANLIFLLNNKSVLDHLLKQLDEDVHQVWIEEQSNPDAKLALHENVQFVSHCGLSWPFPTEELAENHSHHLLSRVLLKMEQKHQINVDDRQHSPVPTFVGFIPESVIKLLIEQKKLWNEENKLAGFFYHGKMTHRIQFYLIMKALELGLLDIDGLTVPEVMELLLTQKLGAKMKSAWNMILDDIMSNYNIAANAVMSSYPVNVFPVKHARIDGGKYALPYLFGCDPFFLHSYIMSASRRQTPYLSECVTQMFAKSALAIQRLEKETGWKRVIDDYVINHRFDRNFAYAKLEESELTMENVLKRQAFCFAVFGYHYISLHHINADRKQRGKEDDELYAGMQYRVHPRKKPVPVQTGPSWFQFFADKTSTVIGVGAAVMAVYSIIK